MGNLLISGNTVGCRADSRLVPSQWETSLQSITPSHIGWAQTIESALRCLSNIDIIIIMNESPHLNHVLPERNIYIKETISYRVTSYLWWIRSSNVLDTVNHRRGTLAVSRSAILQVNEHTKSTHRKYISSFALTSVIKSNRYKILHMTGQLCCRGICKICCYLKASNFIDCEPNKIVNKMIGVGNRAYYDW